MRVYIIFYFLYEFFHHFLQHFAGGREWDLQISFFT